MNVSRFGETKGRVKHPLLPILLALPVLAITACQTTGPKGPTYPTDAEAKRHYALGANHLEEGAYEKAAQELRQSIEIEPEPFLPHARLATAYYAQQKYSEASAAFERATESSGGPRNAGPLPIMQALSLMRDGKAEEARELLTEISGPDIVVTASGSYSAASGRLSGIWKTAAGYLLGNVSEKEYLKSAPQSDLSFPYLFIGIKSVVENDRAKANDNLTKAFALTGRGQWRGVIAKAELDILKKRGGRAAVPTTRSASEWE